MSMLPVRQMGLCPDISKWKNMTNNPSHRHKMHDAPKSLSHWPCIFSFSSCSTSGECPYIEEVLSVKPPPRKLPSRSLSMFITGSLLRRCCRCSYDTPSPATTMLQLFPPSKLMCCGESTANCYKSTCSPGQCKHVLGTAVENSYSNAVTLKSCIDNGGVKEHN